MESIGITRRMDELGRIVIPKEIRNKLHIKTGELLEIYSSSVGEILIRKYSTINLNNVIINEFLKVASKELKANIILTNLDEVVYSTNSSYKGNIVLEDMKRISILDNFPDEIKINSNIIIKGPYEIFPLNVNGDLIGFLIIKYIEKNNIENKKLVDTIVNFLTIYHENN